jgi:Nuclear transport factor 2 (NTF2) domain
VAPIPVGYQLSTEASELLRAIRQLDGGQQLTVFQDVVVKMGYSPTGDTPKVKEPVVPPQEAAPRTKVQIQGIQDMTVLSYMEDMNAFDFPAAVALFAEEGALKPPFQEPIVGQENILAYMREECYGLKLLPVQGISEPVEGGFTQIKVTGKVQTPWFSNRAGINLAWRFLLNPAGKIFFVGIDVLASPKELLNLGLVR